jgi:hypothetical protein
MNDLDLMERFRADVPAAGSGALSQARAAMFHERPARRVTRARWQLVPVAGLAAAALIAVAVAAWPSHAPPVPALDGAQVLRLAADEARQQPLLAARPDQFVFFDTKIAFPAPTGPRFAHPPGAHPPEGRTQQMWLSVDGRRDGAFHATTEGNAGSLPVSGQVLHGAPAYRRDLPTDVAAMRRYLYAFDGRTGSADGNAWAGVFNLLHDQYLPPDTAAALFEAAATIPGSTVLRNQTDLAGRPGLAVSRVNGEFRQDLIFDLPTHRYLGERDTELRDTSIYAKGTVVGASALLRVAIVDRAGQLP